MPLEKKLKIFSHPAASKFGYSFYTKEIKSFMSNSLINSLDSVSKMVAISIVSSDR